MNRFSALTKSLIFHAVVIVLVSVGFIFKDDVVQVSETPIEVSFMNEEMMESASKQPEPVEDVPPPIEEKPPAPPKAVEQPKPKEPDVKVAEKTQEKAPEPKVEEPKPEPVPQPEPAPKPEPKKPVEKPKPEPAPEPEPKEEPKEEPKPVEEPKPKPAEEPAKEETQADFMSVLKNLQDSEPQDTARNGPTLTESPTVDRMSTGELDAFRRQLSRCWSILPGAVQADALAVNLTINVNRDRTVRDVQIIDKARYSSDPFFRAAADNAIRAIKHPDCTPLDLPTDKYNTWNTITLNFDPRTMF